MQMELYLHTQDNRILTIGFSEQDTINLLQKKIRTSDSSNFVFFFNNNVLQGGFTFSFYKITNGDHIYTIPIQKKQTKQMVFEEIRKAQKMIDSKLQESKRETERVKDIMLKKVEANSQQYRIILKRFNKYLQIEDSRKIHLPSPSIIGSISEPATQPLPAFWKE